MNSRSIPPNDSNPPNNSKAIAIVVVAYNHVASLATVLDRIPDYAIEKASVERLRSEFVAGITAMPATY